MELKHISIKVKLIIFVYMLLSITKMQKIDKSLIILMLLYLISIFSNGIVKEKYRIILSAFEGLCALFIGIKFIPIAMVLLIITMLELALGKIKDKGILFALIALPLLLIRDYLLNSEIIVLVLVIALFFSYYFKEQHNLFKMERENEQRRKEIYKLQSRLKEEQNFKEQFLYTMQLEERNKLSGKLHDRIGHTISGTLLQLEAIKLTIDNNKEQGKKLLDMSIDNLRKGMNDIRMILREIRPQQEELGINRIKLILEEKTKNTRFKYSIRHSGDLEKISASNWIIFVQAVKELSTNSIKYSKGTEIDVNITILNKIIKLEVRDNGIGSMEVKKGIGLSNLEEKIAEINGQLIVDGTDGFSVILIIPF
ncbi:two-component sensor histidine kinase [Clostridium sp. NSJ-49]|uniref:histidine kinase n=2 Tax=Clostridium disporicum TaxID=84024 RepID=A0A174IGV0_9CLOT|nr:MULTISPECIES: histidine kinase [Clostridium]MBC5625809.1 two-component sensor histidine kinase [Clostridium sp. NSJ-49]MCD2500918.1 two-component sensor histidine kinase [Clostridium sp. NSJ-145]MDU6341230.1 histidine kinase [Clostridium sp.]CUO84179.1 signal transduction histidine kinase [Clostridium disporicum]